MICLVFGFWPFVLTVPMANLFTGRHGGLGWRPSHFLALRYQRCKPMLDLHRLAALARSSLTVSSAARPTRAQALRRLGRDARSDRRQRPYQPDCGASAAELTSVLWVGRWLATEQKPGASARPCRRPLATAPVKPVCHAAAAHCSAWGSDCSSNVWSDIAFECAVHKPMLGAMNDRINQLLVQMAALEADLRAAVHDQESRMTSSGWSGSPWRLGVSDRCSMRAGLGQGCSMAHPALPPSGG